MVISVIVLTYNSSNFVEELLDSIKNQSYENIELIITDDCSLDNTITKIQKWSELNKNRFVNMKILQSKYNTGISLNANRGLKAATGKYCKLIAGDDILTFDCLKDNAAYAIKNDIDFLFSKMQTFRVVENKIEYGVCLPADKQKRMFNYNSKKQFKTIIKGMTNIAPTSFIKTESIMKLGGFLGEFKYFEDYPMWFTATLNNYKLYYMDKSTVYYRIHEKSISYSKDDQYCNERLYAERYLFYQKYRKKYLIKNFNLLCLIQYELTYYINMKVISRGNKKSDYTIELRLLRLIDLLSVIFKIKKIFRTIQASVINTKTK